MNRNLYSLVLMSCLLRMLQTNPIKRLGLVLALILMVCNPCSVAKEDTLKLKAAIALGKASAYMHAISTNGGYAGIYSKDLMERYGEGLSHKAQLTQIWVQPPGTPSVGECFLRAYQITGDGWYLSAAVDAARALAWGQSSIGGWGYLIDVGHLDRDAETVVRKESRCTFDDNTTQAALQFLMAMDEVVDESWLTEAVELGLTFMLKAQYENGAWPQSYPPKGGYGGYYTFNDRAMNDCIKVMVRAHRTYGKSEYLESAKHGGDFIILSQLPAPQAGWAQQYSKDLKPAWARSFEPPGVCSAVTCSNIYTLVDLYLYTREKKYLESIPKAIAWLKASKIGDNLWARLYEVGTNRPIYGDREDGGKVHYDYEKISEREKRNYLWQANWGMEGAFAHYERVIQNDTLSNSAEVVSKPATARSRVSKELQTRVREIVGALDDEGRWLRDEMIYTGVFVQNARVLCDYLEVAGYDHVEVAKLVDSDADLSEDNRWKQEWDALREFRRSKPKEIVDLIHAGLTSIHEEARRGNLANVRGLLEEGADVNARNSSGKTPLHIAVETGHKEMAELLIKGGADVNAKDDEDKTPIEVVRRSNRKELVGLLKKHGATGEPPQTMMKRWQSMSPEDRQKLMEEARKRLEDKIQRRQELNREDKLATRSAHDVAVIKISVAPSCIQGEIVSIVITLDNQGDCSESGTVALIDATKDREIARQSATIHSKHRTASEADMTFTGENQGDRFGSQLDVGDVNGDGYADLYLGAGSWSRGGNTGRGYLYYGGSHMNNMPDKTFTGEHVGDLFSAGLQPRLDDINNDGFDDLIVPARMYNRETGRVYIFYGGTNMDEVSDIHIDPPASEGTGIRFGRSIACGDINNDGNKDLVIGAGYYDNVRGCAYLYYGPISSNAKPAKVFEGEGPNQRFSDSGAWIGDVDGDGYGDLLLATRYYPDISTVGDGRAYIYWGAAGTSMDVGPDVILTSQEKGDEFGAASYLSDIDHDGHVDILLTSRKWGSANRGRSYLYWGSPRDTFDAKPDVIFTGENDVSAFGGDCIYAGNVNGDEYADFLVNAYAWDNNSNQSRVYLFLGGPRGVIKNIHDCTFTGNGPDFWSFRSRIADFNNDGHGDVVMGGYGYDEFRGQALLWYGPFHTSTDITFHWDTTNISPGKYTLKASIAPVPGEKDIEDNAVTATIKVKEK